MTILTVLRALLPPLLDIHLSASLEVDFYAGAGARRGGWGGTGAAAGGTAHGPGTTGARGAAARSEG